MTTAYQIGADPNVAGKIACVIPITQLFMGASIGCETRQEATHDTLENQLAHIIANRQQEDRQALSDLVQCICRTVGDSISSMLR